MYEEVQIDDLQSYTHVYISIEASAATIANAVLVVIGKTE